MKYQLYDKVKKFNFTLIDLKQYIYEGCFVVLSFKEYLVTSMTGAMTAGSG